MATIVNCDWCTRLQKFEDRQAGVAWIKVEVLDGDKAFLMSATFCCPECALDYLTSREHMGTIGFPDPIGMQGAREVNFPLLSGPCSMQAHSVCGGRAERSCQCHCHHKEQSPTE